MEKSKLGPRVRWDDGVGTVIPAQAGTERLPRLPCVASERHWVPAFAGMTVHGVKQSASTAAAGADHNFATHLDSVVPQRAPALIHMLVDRPSTPGVDNPDTDPSCTGQNFATHLDSPVAQGADAVIHTVSPMSFHSWCGQAGSWNMRPLPVGAT